MLTSGKQIRFTIDEVESARQLGIDLASVRTTMQYSDAIVRLIGELEANRPELLEKIARALADKTGRPLPAKLWRVR